MLENVKRICDLITDENTIILLSLDLDDKTIDYNRLSSLKKYSKKVKVFLGKSETKINAYNRDLVNIDFDYVLPISDYTEIYAKGFDSIIIKQISIYRELVDLVNGKADIGLFFKSINSCNSNKNHLSVHHLLYLIPKTFYDKRKYIYSPALKNNFHNEILKKQLQAFTKNVYPCTVPIHKYVHPLWFYSEVDKYSIQAQKTWKDDLKILEHYGI